MEDSRRPQVISGVMWNVYIVTRSRRKKGLGVRLDRIVFTCPRQGQVGSCCTTDWVSWSSSTSWGYSGRPDAHFLSLQGIYIGLKFSYLYFFPMKASGFLEEEEERAKPDKQEPLGS